MNVDFSTEGVQSPYSNRLCIGLQPIADKSLFCTWRVEANGDQSDKIRKVPYVRGGVRLTGRFGDPELLPKLMTLAEAIAESEKRQCTGVGIAFFPGCGVIGVDLDHCLDENYRFVGTPAQRRALGLMKGKAFFERSQSNTGVHAIALGNTQTVKVNGELEIFGDRNFLALTGFGGKGVAQSLEAIKLERLVRCVVELKETVVKRSTTCVGAASPDGQEQLDRVIDALRYIHPDVDRDTWVRIIFAIRHGLGDHPEAFALADDWSTGALYAGR